MLACMAELISFFMIFLYNINVHAAGKNLSEDQVEAMIESDDPQIFTQDVSCSNIIGESHTFNLSLSLSLSLSLRRSC